MISIVTQSGRHLQTIFFLNVSLNLFICCRAALSCKAFYIKIYINIAIDLFPT